MKRLVFSALVPIVCLLAPSGAVLADNFVAGISSNGNVPLNTAAQWTIVRQVTVTIPLADAGAHSCVANASADVENPAGAVSQYLFVVSHNDFNPLLNGGSERLVELVDNPGVNDPNSKPVSTTRHWGGLTNNNGDGASNNVHNFYFLGRKVDPTFLDTDVLDASFNVICVEV